MMRSLLRQRAALPSRPIPSPVYRRAYTTPPPPKPPTPTSAAPNAAGSSSSSSTGPKNAGQSYQERLNAHYAARMKHNRSILFYVVGALALATGTTYAAVPAYRAFCAATGFAGTPMTDPSRFEPEKLYATDESKGRPITVRFQATSSDTLPWSFTPVQKSVTVVPGQTALAFYTAKNHSDKDLIGIATYNMTPDRIAPYFAKVECFCFEEQKIRAGEEVDLPVFFFIDRDIMDDPTLDQVDDVVLSYTFFRARRNDMGHLVPDAPLAEVEKSMGWEGYDNVPAKPVSQTA